MPRSSRAARPHRRPVTPSRPRRLMPSPPLSPTSTDTHHSEDERLEGSYLLVSGEEDETCSTVGSSLRDSVIGDIFSDSSSEDPIGREGWDASTDGGESFNGDNDLTRAESELFERTDLVGGSYADAEATASELAESSSTIQRGLDSISSSQIRLIMPDPSSSFSTSSGTLSPGETPNGSVANLVGSRSTVVPRLPFARRQSTIRAIDKSWLEASKLWNMAPEVQSMLVEPVVNDDQRLDRKGHDDLLASREDVQPSSLNPRVEAELDGSTECDSLPIVKRIQLRRVLVTDGIAGLRQSTKRWSVRMSMLALASVLSLALFRSWPSSNTTTPMDNPGPDTAPMSETDALSVIVQLGGKTLSLWDRISLSPLAASTTGSHASSADPQAAQYIPDLQIIKQALSTFSTKSAKGVPAEPMTTDQVDNKGEVGRAPRRKPENSSLCCALSIPNEHVALTVATVPGGLSTVDGSWAKTIRRKVLRGPANDTRVVANTTKPLEPCLRSLSYDLRSGLLASIVTSLGPIQQYTLSATRMIVTIYGPAMAELKKEFGELLALTKAMAETTSTLTEFVIRRAARGVAVSRRVLDEATNSLRQHIPPLPQGPIVDHEAVARARAQIDTLSVYVEDQAAAMAVYLEEQSALMHEKGMESLKQAKRGLDKLIDEARKVVDGEEHDKLASVHAAGPMPFAQMGGRKWRPVQLSRMESVKERTRRAWRREGRSGHPPPDRPSIGRNIFDMVHHAAMAFVL